MKRKIASDINYEIIKTAESIPNTTNTIISELGISADAIKNWITNELQNNKEYFSDETPQVDVRLVYNTLYGGGGGSDITIRFVQAPAESNQNNEDWVPEKDIYSDYDPSFKSRVKRILNICEERLGLMEADAKVSMLSGLAMIMYKL